MNCWTLRPSTTPATGRLVESCCKLLQGTFGLHAPYRRACQTRFTCIPAFQSWVRPPRVVSQHFATSNNNQDSHEYYLYKDDLGRSFRVKLAKSRNIVGVRSTRGSSEGANEDRYKAATVWLQERGRKHQWLYFGVFDGHGGSHVSDFATANLHLYLEQCRLEDYKDVMNYFRKTIGGEWADFRPQYLQRLEQTIPVGPAPIAEMTVEERVTLAYLLADVRFLQMPAMTGQGSTASVCLARGADDDPVWACRRLILYVAHVGDSKILLSNADGRAVPLTRDHHAKLPEERERLQRHGDAVVADSHGDQRVAGLSNTRSLGDMQAKLLGVSPEPELTKFEADAAELGFVCLVSDGITNVLSDQEIVDVVKQCADPTSAAMHLVDVADQFGSEDNQTALVLRLPGWGRQTPDYTLNTRKTRVQGRSVKSGELSGKYAYEDVGAMDALREDILAKTFAPQDGTGDDGESPQLTERQIVERIEAQSVQLLLDTGIFPPENEDGESDAPDKERSSRLASTARAISTPESKRKNNSDIVHLFFSVLGKAGYITPGVGIPAADERKLTLQEARNAWTLLGVRAKKPEATEEAERLKTMADKSGVVLGPPGVGPDPPDERQN